MATLAKVQHSFSRALASYEDHAVVQKECAKKLLEYLQNSALGTHQSRIFEFGCGTGFLTKQLNQQLTSKELIVNDLVAECLDYLPQLELDFIVGDIDQISLPNACDLICSASSIQWSRDIPNLLARFHTALKTNGHLAISSFSTNQFKELKVIEGNSGKSSALRFLSKESWHEYLHTNYDVQVIEAHETVLWFRNVREILLHLRATGVNGIAGQVWSQQSLNKFEEEYRDKFEHNGKVPLTYHPIYVIAQKKG